MTEIPERPFPIAPWPTFWPPYDRLAAAGMGDLYGATIRRLSSQRQDSNDDPVKFAEAQIEAAQDREVITDADARRLLAYLALGRDEGEPNEGERSAAQLFEATLDDPNSSTLALAILSIAKYREETETAMADSLPHGPKAADGYLLGVAAMLGATEVILAMYMAEHVHIS